jgi:hypothetical protein
MQVFSHVIRLSCSAQHSEQQQLGEQLICARPALLLAQRARPKHYL